MSGQTIKRPSVPIIMAFCFLMGISVIVLQNKLEKQASQTIKMIVINEGKEVLKEHIKKHQLPKIKSWVQEKLNKGEKINPKINVKDISVDIAGRKLTLQKYQDKFYFDICDNQDKNCERVLFEKEKFSRSDLVEVFLFIINELNLKQDVVYESSFELPNEQLDKDGISNEIKNPNQKNSFFDILKEQVDKEQTFVVNTMNQAASAVTTQIIKHGMAKHKSLPNPESASEPQKQ